VPPKKFRFRLQSILDYKQKLEDEEKEKLAKLLQEEVQAQEYLVGLRNRKATDQQEMRSRQQAGTMDVDELKRFNQHLKYLEKAIENQLLYLRELAIRIEAQRQALVKAAQERKVFEKLKEKHHEVFIQGEETEERKLIDELATLRYAREETSQPDLE